MYKPKLFDEAIRHVANSSSAPLQVGGKGITVGDLCADLLAARQEITRLSQRLRSQIWNPSNPRRSGIVRDWRELTEKEIACVNTQIFRHGLEMIPTPSDMRVHYQATGNFTFAFLSMGNGEISVGVSKRMPTDSVVPDRGCEIALARAARCVTVIRVECETE